jgi:hypothetical protein
MQAALVRRPTRRHAARSAALAEWVRHVSIARPGPGDRDRLVAHAPQIAPRTFLAGVPLFGELDAASSAGSPQASTGTEARREAVPQNDAATGIRRRLRRIHLVATTPRAARA